MGLGKSQIPEMFFNKQHDMLALNSFPLNFLAAPPRPAGQEIIPTLLAPGRSL
jgi:hypothetical protein